MLIFSLLCLSKQDTYQEGSHIIPIYAGYYRVELRGAQGGQACYDGKHIKDYKGGKGAKFIGILHQKAVDTYELIVGSKPVPNCEARVNPAGKFGEGGNSGRDGEWFGTPDPSGAGGGYTALKIATDGNKIAAMVGGGSGAAKKKT